MFYVYSWTFTLLSQVIFDDVEIPFYFPHFIAADTFDSGVAAVFHGQDDDAVYCIARRRGDGRVLRVVLKQRPSDGG